MSIYWLKPGESIENFILPVTDATNIQTLEYTDNVYGLITRICYPEGFWYETITDSQTQDIAIRSNWHTVPQDGKHLLQP